jgi:hypothetical protein
MTFLFYVSDIEWDAEGMNPETDCGLPPRTFIEIGGDTSVGELYEAIGIALHDRHHFKPIRYSVTLASP